MAIERIVGVDFGTSTSVIAVKRYKNSEPVVDGTRLDCKIVGDKLIHTAIRDENDHRYFCEDALTPKKRNSNAVDYYGFKVDLESANIEKRNLARELTRDFLTHIARNLYNPNSEGGQLGEITDTERTIISYPVKWSEDTKAFMIESARKAGFKNVEGMDEAQAAIQAATVRYKDTLLAKKYLQEDVPATIMLIDMGAGTTDLALCRYTPGNQSKTETLTTWPKDGHILFGGQEIDKLLKEYVTTLFTDESQAKIVLNRISTAQFKEWKEIVVSKELSHNNTIEGFYIVDNFADMLGADMKPYNLNRATFESYAEDYLKQLPVLVSGCLESAGITGDQVDLVILTGGHSQWYFVKEMLTGKMPNITPALFSKIASDPDRVIQCPDPQKTVAEGLVFSGFFNNSEDYSHETFLNLVENDPLEAIRYITPFAEAGYAIAQYNLGELYWKYDTPEKDINKAIYWYEKAGEQNDADALLSLGVIYINKDDITRYNSEKALNYLEQAVAAGSVKAQVCLAATYFQLDQKEKAFELNKKLAEQHNLISAQYLTGGSYYLGQGTEIDFSEALKWLYRVLDNPNEATYREYDHMAYKASALRLLSDAYENGNGVPVNMEKANEYKRKADELSGSDNSEEEKSVQKKQETSQTKEKVGYLQVTLLGSLNPMQYAKGTTYCFTIVGNGIETKLNLVYRGWCEDSKELITLPCGTYKIKLNVFACDSNPETDSPIRSSTFYTFNINERKTTYCEIYNINSFSLKQPTLDIRNS